MPDARGVGRARPVGAIRGGAWARRRAPVPTPGSGPGGAYGYGVWIGRMEAGGGRPRPAPVRTVQGGGLRGTDAGGASLSPHPGAHRADAPHPCGFRPAGGRAAGVVALVGCGGSLCRGARAAGRRGLHRAERPRPGAHAAWARPVERGPAGQGLTGPVGHSEWKAGGVRKGVACHPWRKHTAARLRTGRAAGAPPGPGA